MPLCWLSFGREKKSSGLQLPRKAEAKALSNVTALSCFHESCLSAINLEALAFHLAVAMHGREGASVPGSQNKARTGKVGRAGWGSFQASFLRRQHQGTTQGNNAKGNNYLLPYRF